MPLAASCLHLLSLMDRRAEGTATTLCHLLSALHMIDMFILFWLIEGRRQSGSVSEFRSCVLRRKRAR